MWTHPAVCAQILPTAQRLLDELLSSQSTAINTVCGAPGKKKQPSASQRSSAWLELLHLQLGSRNKPQGPAGLDVDTSSPAWSCRFTFHQEQALS